MLKAALLDRDFVESIPDPCVYITKDLLVLVHVDDCILISKEQLAITSFVQSLHDGPENVVFAEEGTLESYLGVCILLSFQAVKDLKCLSSFLLAESSRSLDLSWPPPKEQGTTCQPPKYPLLNKDVDGPARKAKWK